MSESEEELNFDDLESLPGVIRERLDYSVDPKLAIFRPKGKELGKLLEITGWWHYFKALVQDNKDQVYPYYAGGMIKETTKGEGWLVYGAVAIYMPKPKLIFRRMLLCIPKPGWENDRLIRTLTEALVQTFIEEYGRD